MRDGGVCLCVVGLDRIRGPNTQEDEGGQANEDVAATDARFTVADLDPRILALRERSENRVRYSRYVATGPCPRIHDPLWRRGAPSWVSVNFHSNGFFQSTATYVI